MKTIKLVTWNVNGIRASFGKGLSQFIQDEKPDIICLQETKAHKEQVNPEMQSLGYPFHYWSSAERKGYSGTATFLHSEPKKSLISMDKPDYEKEGRIVWTQHEEFDLYNIYFPNGGSGEARHNFKQKFLKELLAHLKFEMKKGKQIIVVGDYNVAHLQFDVHDPVRLSKESGFLPEEREWFTEFLKSGFVDCYRHLHPDKKEAYSWWSYRELARTRNKGWRIDYICATQDLIKNLKSCEILMNQLGSDHCPVVAEFKF
ncbi:MAG: exodeoxyribonuclease III [Bdellovibrio sp.]|nr:exodeoxyribonuclease III [Bdellovibrio sp.]